MCAWQVISTSSTVGTFAAYASTDCSGDAVNSTSTMGCLNAGSLNVKVVDYEASSTPAYGVVFQEWTGTTTCTSQAPGASWIKAFDEGSCVFFIVHGGNVFYRSTHCMDGGYSYAVFTDSACTSVYPYAPGLQGTSTECAVSNNGSNAYPYQRGTISFCAQDPALRRYGAVACIH